MRASIIATLTAAAMLVATTAGQAQEYRDGPDRGPDPGAVVGAAILGGVVGGLLGAAGARRPGPRGDHLFRPPGVGPAALGTGPHKGGGMAPHPGGGKRRKPGG